TQRPMRATRPQKLARPWRLGSWLLGMRRAPSPSRCMPNARSRPRPTSGRTHQSIGTANCAPPMLRHWPASWMRLRGASRVRSEP
ncbi:hypothetical protein BCR44DRAFT_1438363, partial [Catenaria anguillulae PL171]